MVQIVSVAGVKVGKNTELIVHFSTIDIQLDITREKVGFLDKCIVIKRW